MFSQIKDEEINRGREKLKDEEIVKLISRQIKKLEESLSLFIKAKRDDLIVKTKKEIESLKKYLPQQLTDAELKERIEEIIKKNARISNPGQLIGIAIKALSGQADNRRISEAVKNQLTN